jgi:heme-degrading monooxygenase HmoA
MDESMTLKDQMEEEASRPVILIDKFNVNPEQVDKFLDVWKRDTTEFKKQPAFISMPLHRGIGKSSFFIIYTGWEPVRDFKNAVDKILG